MPILSITFHTTPEAFESWKQYIENELLQVIENLMEVKKFILSEVETEMISEGKNTNLLLVFENNETRSQFVENKLINITERTESKFGNEVMIFKTYLNPKSYRL